MIKTRACMLLLAGASFAPAAAFAQDGGLSASLVLSERLEAARNRALSPDGGDITLQSVTTLNYGFLSETRTQSLAFDLGLGLNGSLISEGDPSFSLGERSLALDYGLEGATSSLDVSFGASQSDVAFLRPLSDFIEDGGLVLPEDFDDLTGSGTRTDLSFGARMTLRDDAPFGITLSADANDVRYRDTTDPELVDSTRLGFGFSGRFDIGPAIQATAGLRYSIAQEDGGAESDSITYRADITLAEPRGELGFGLSLTPSEDGTQIGVDLSRSFDLPGGSLGGQIGVTLTSDESQVLTGGLDYTRELPLGEIAASFDHSVATDAGQTGDVTTSLSLLASTALTPDINASLNAGYARYEEAGSDVVTSIADLGATVSYAFAPDWSLSAGASYILRDPSDAEAAAAQSLSLTVTRSFDMRR
jgi:hypothetical protein